MASRIEEVSGLIKSAAWPLIALLALVLFLSPIRNTLEAISRNSGDIDDVKLGGLELQIRQRDLPSSSPEVATAIIGLNEREVVMLLMISPENGYDFFKCGQGIGFADEVQNPLMDLQKRNIVTFEPKNSSTDSNCPYELFAHLTDNGKIARSFVVNLVTAQLKSASSTRRPQTSN